MKMAAIEPGSPENEMVGWLWDGMEKFSGGPGTRGVKI